MACRVLGVGFGVQGQGKVCRPIEINMPWLHRGYTRIKRTKLKHHVQVHSCGSVVGFLAPRPSLKMTTCRKKIKSVRPLVVAESNP